MSKSKSNLRESFRPRLQVKSIGALRKEYPNHKIKAVRYDTGLDPDGERIDRYLDSGWEIISSDETVVDDRSTAPKSKEATTLRKKPLTKKGKGDAEFVYMMIPNEAFDENQRARLERDKGLMDKKQKVVRKGNQLHVTHEEINEHNINFEE